ncbi:MAG: DUF3899 domain-containing protein [Paraclostridium sordellii]|uniref:DUF3899 domain-containing protein n=1 Tax=Paraclostridium sordellii TaxID=1505 RepID=A0A9P1L4A7_PARSO|nr:DUF3899 domain-containing protein [Paeniclostridium sordellii]MCQ4697893.1 DUF3899 domain-containing protein [Paeniclostridium sordellii]MDU1454389.1 DUF3899 domain-containing protein [Paeniclostridium sordellii]CEO35126.1 Uncharacterised protein [[Clostridium] sordellii] [Paeniclostridium sordellii]
MKKFHKLILANLILSFLFYSFNNFERFSFINSSFVIGMIYLSIGVLFYVTEQGVFNLTIYAYNKISSQLQRNRGILSDGPVSIDDYINKRYQFTNTNSLLTSGLIISIANLFISFLIY